MATYEDLAELLFPDVTETIENLESVEISISHCRSYACANAIAIYKD